MLEKLSQLREIEKMTAKAAKDAKANKKHKVEPSKSSIHTSTRASVQQTTRPSSKMSTKMKSTRTLESVKSQKGGKSKSRQESRLDKSELDRTMNEYLKHSTSQVIREKKSTRNTSINSRSRSGPRLHPRLCEMHSHKNERIVKSRNDKMQTYRSSKSRHSSTKSRASGKSVKRRPYPDPAEFQSNACIEMYANQYLNGGRLSNGVSDYVHTDITNTEPVSKVQTRTVTPEQQTRIAEKYKSNQKDSKVPDERSETSRTMEMEELLCQQKDSAHHTSDAVLNRPETRHNLNRQDFTRPELETRQTIEVERVQPSELNMFFEKEYK